MAQQHAEVTYEKGQSNVHEVELDGYGHHRDGSHDGDEAQRPEIAEDGWAPGANVPWIAAAEVGVAIICTVIAIIVVTLSDGKPQGSWYIPASKHTKRVTIEPKLILSVLSSLLTLALGLALKEGLTVTWWRRALVGGRVRDLDRTWTTGTSVLQAALAGRYITYVAFGLLLVTATGIAESTLMQRSTSVVARPVKDATPFAITSQIATKLPYTGWNYVGGLTPSYLDPAFAGIVRSWTSNAQIQSSFTGCEGTCSAFVSGAGLAADCKATASNVTIGPVAFNQTWPMRGNSSSTYPPQWKKEYVVFQTDFDIGVWDENTATAVQINMTTISSTSKTAANEDCPRNINTQHCSLRPAIVKYPVAMTNTTLNLDQTHAGGSPFFEVEKYLALNDSEYIYTSLGGIYLALESLYASKGSLSWHGDFGDGYMFTPTGSLAQNYFHPPSDNAADAAYMCNQTLADPTLDLLSSINDLMFRVAISNSSLTDQADAQAIPTGLANYYTSSFLFLGLAVALAYINILVIIPLFWGWWGIGRKLSLNPIEIAEAFNAPVLHKDAGHRDVGGLLEQVGDRAVVFRPVERSVDTEEGRRVYRQMKIVTPQG